MRTSKEVRANPEIVRGDDGELYLRWSDDEDDEIDPKFGGGYRPRRLKKTRIEGEEVEVFEIETLASGSSFSPQKAPLPFVPPEEREKLIEIGYDLWKHDPLGGAIVNLTTFFTFGRGLSVQASGVAESVLKKFWKKNDLGRKSKVLSDESTAFGEVFVKLAPKKDDVKGSFGNRFFWRSGQVEFVPIAPEIVYSIKHNPVNVDDIEEYVLKYKTGEKVGGQDQIREERLPPLEKFDPDRHEAAVIHLKFNAASNDVYGSSDLVRIKEWLGHYAEFLRDGVAINKLYRSPCFDITIIDGDDTDVRRAVRRYENWTIGSNPVHNDKEQWEILEFTGANVSQEDSRRALLLVIAAGANLPEYMIADGANANLASSKAQQLPAIRKFEDRQESWRWFWRRIFEFVLDSASELGRVKGLEAEEDFEGDPQWMVDVKFPPILTEKDAEIAQANRLGIEDGYMSPQTAAARAGLDYEQEAELRYEAAIEEERMKIRIEGFRQSEDFKTLMAEFGVKEGPDTEPSSVPPPPQEEEEEETEEEDIEEDVKIERGGRR